MFGAFHSVLFRTLSPPFYFPSLWIWTPNTSNEWKHTAFDDCAHFWQENLHRTATMSSRPSNSCGYRVSGFLSHLFPHIGRDADKYRLLRTLCLKISPNSLFLAGYASCFWWWGSFPCISRLILLPVQVQALAPPVPQVCHTVLALPSLAAHVLTSLVVSAPEQVLALLQPQPGI